jgi:hypothetical protein
MRRPSPHNVTDDIAALLPYFTEPPKSFLAMPATMRLSTPMAATAAMVVSVLASYLFPQTFASGSLTKLLSLFITCHFFFVSLDKLIIYPFFIDPLRHLPQAPGFRPLVGHEFTLFKRPLGEPHLKIMKEVDNDGLILTRGFFHSDKVIVTSTAALADILVHKSYDMEKPPPVRTFLRKFLGDGLLMTEGDEYDTSTCVSTR